MADAVTSQTLFDGQSRAVMAFTNVSDGTGESAVLKVDVSSLNADSTGRTCSRVTIKKIHAACNGLAVNILWDATTDVTSFAVGTGNYTFDLSDAPLWNNAGTGVTGDILFTTIGATLGDTYSIVLEMVKTYS